MRIPPWRLVAIAVLLAAACARSSYTPSSTVGGLTFREACSDCHSGASSPGGSLRGKNLPAEKVEQRLRFGGEGMPAFPRIQGEARTNLVQFVVAMSRTDSHASP